MARGSSTIRWVVALSIGVIFNALANILIKYAMFNKTNIEFTTLSIIKSILNPYLLLGLTCFGLALGAYSYSLTKYELSVAYPVMTSLGLIIVAQTSAFLFQESFGLQKILGTALIIIGVVLVARA